MAVAYLVSSILCQQEHLCLCSYELYDWFITVIPVQVETEVE